MNLTILRQTFLPKLKLNQDLLLFLSCSVGQEIQDSCPGPGKTILEIIIAKPIQALYLLHAIKGASQFYNLVKELLRNNDFNEKCKLLKLISREYYYMKQKPASTTWTTIKRGQQNSSHGNNIFERNLK